MTTPITELDFDNIKASLINFIKSNETFSDYNFEGSALNAIMDILAYNTHTNAYMANMIHSEGFLDTAQKRMSVVSRAKELGYIPKSVICSVATVNVVLQTNTGESTLLSRGDSFKSSNSNGTYTFLVAETIAGVHSGTQTSFSGVKIYNGTRITNNYFTVDTTSNLRSLFTIPNPGIDISTLKVYVRDSISTTDRTEYFIADSLFDLKSDSKVYYIQEAYNGLFQIYFGNNVLGIQPVNGNIISLDYFTSSNKDLANGCTRFTMDSTPGVFGTVTTIQRSASGADKETIDSIKRNAVINNTAKTRAVTALDYESVIRNNFTFIRNVSVWGGEDNTPPIYGKVFITLQPVTGYVVTEDVKHNLITPLIKNYAMLTVTPEYVDPEYFELAFSTDIKYNYLKTNTNIVNLESSIKTTIIDYIESISTFNTDYIHSTLINNLLDVDSSIASIDVRKEIGFRIAPPTGVSTTYTKVLYNEILIGTVYSTKFNIFYNGTQTAVNIRDIPITFNQVTSATGTKNYVSLGLYTTDNALVSTIGTLELLSGTFNFNISVYSYISSNMFILLKFKVNTPDISIIKNQFLVMQPTVIDTSINLLSNNIVNIINYGK